MDNILIALAIILFLDLLFVAVRASLLNARLPHLADLQSSFPRQVDLALRLLEQPRLRASLRLGVVTMHFLLAGIVWLWFLQITHWELSIPLVAGGMLVIALGVLVLEFLLEGQVLRNIEGWTVRLVGLAAAIDFIFSPFTWLLLKLLGSSANLSGAPELVIEDELKSWVADGETGGGGLEKPEREMIYSIFQFVDTLCREIMVPRIDVFALDVETPLPEAAITSRDTGHSRVPVYEDSIDNIIGLLYVKDLVGVLADDQRPASLRSLLRPVKFVPEAKKVSELLREMQNWEVHMVVVVDEYGGMAGLVTLEDIVEEIVGEIRDEYDHAEEELYQEIGPEEYLFQGRIDLDDFNDTLNTHLTKEVADTLGGFIYGQIGRVPVEGEQVRVEDWVLTVERVRRRRIEKVRAILRPPQPQEEENDHHETD